MDHESRWHGIERQLDADDLAELSDANGLTCPSPLMDVEAEIQSLSDALWQPRPMSREPRSC